MNKDVNDAVSKSVVTDASMLDQSHNKFARENTMKERSNWFD